MDVLIRAQSLRRVEQAHQSAVSQSMERVPHLVQAQREVPQPEVAARVLGQAPVQVRLSAQPKAESVVPWAQPPEEAEQPAMARQAAEVERPLVAREVEEARLLVPRAAVAVLPLAVRAAEEVPRAAQPVVEEAQLSVAQAEVVLLSGARLALVQPLEEARLLAEPSARSDQQARVRLAR